MEINLRSLLGSSTHAQTSYMGQPMTPFGSMTAQLPWEKMFSWWRSPWRRTWATWTILHESLFQTVGFLQMIFRKVLFFVNCDKPFFDAGKRPFIGRGVWCSLFITLQAISILLSLEWLFFNKAPGIARPNKRTPPLRPRTETAPNPLKTSRARFLICS